jgi:hypothetical protein
MPTIPTIATYKASTMTRLANSALSDAKKYGYSLSEDPINATCFSGILSSNITTLITNQYTENGLTTLDWSRPATLRNTTTANTNGYYYHAFTASTNNTVILPSTNPTGTGQKVVVVDGGNVQINSNIDYSGTNKILVIIARKTN